MQKFSNDTSDACLALVSRFSQAAHDLRQPLNAILGFAQVLQFEDSLTSDQLESIKEIDAAARLMNNRLSNAVNMVAEELEKIADQNRRSTVSNDNL